LEAIARLAARRPVAITVLALAAVIVGWISWRGLPLDLLPDIQSPTVLVSIRSGDRPPLEMERLYGEQVEQRLFTVRGIRSIAQVARSGRLVTRVSFDWSSNMDLAVVDVQKAVASIGADPEVDEVLVRRFDPRQTPVVVFGLVAPSGAPNLAELRRLARRRLAPTLEQLESVAEVRVTGGRDEEVQVRLDRTLMDAWDVTVGAVESRIRAANVDVNAGTLEEGDKVWLVRGVSRFADPADVERVVVAFRHDAGGAIVPVRVSDLGEVVMADAEITDLVRVDGAEGVALSVYKEAGANTVFASRTVRSAVADLAADLPGVEIRLVTDEAALVEDAIRDVEGAALIGILLAVAVLALFLRSAAPTVVVAAAVPVSLLATAFAMRLSGQSLNLMTLGGLALGAGMLVDNAIVVVESIFRQRADGATPEDAAAKGTAAVAGAIAASTLTTCVVFLPVLFLRGLAARLVAGIAFTVVVSLLVSLLVAVLLIPALSRWLLPRRQVAAVDPGSERIGRWVSYLVARAGRVVVVAFLVAAAAVAALARIGTELLPPADPRQLSVRLVGPPGQRVESTAQTVAAVEEILTRAAGEHLEAVLSEVGRLPDDHRLIREEYSEENTAEVRLRLAADGPPASAVIRAAAPAVAALGGLEVEWRSGGSAISAALGNGGPPVEVEIAGRSLPDLRLGAERVRAALAARPELWNVRTSFEGGPPELRLRLDRAIADGLGVDLDAVASVLEAALDGRTVTRLAMGDEERDVVLRLPKGRRNDLLRLPFTTSGGRRLTVGDVARLEEAEGAREIHRRDQRRVALVTARLADGVQAPEGRAAVKEALSGLDLEPGLIARSAGEELERAQTVGELEWAGGLAVLLVLMVLAGSFESLRHPFTVLSALPVALIGVAVFLVPTGRPIGVMAMLGLIVLAGVAVNDAILLVSAARGFEVEGMPRPQALARAAAVRLRPILMTTATTVLALAPLAIGVGEGSELRAPLALTVIGGVLASTVGSLVVVPCVYELLERLRMRR
jgi:HAE1 family hydrophobic/amphiphilic exporter-1